MTTMPASDSNLAQRYWLVSATCMSRKVVSGGRERFDLASQQDLVSRQFTFIVRKSEHGWEELGYIGSDRFSCIYWLRRCRVYWRGSSTLAYASSTVQACGIWHWGWLHRLEISRLKSERRQPNSCSTLQPRPRREHRTKVGPHWY